MPEHCPHDVPQIRDRLSVVEARLSDQRDRHDRLEARLEGMQRDMDVHHAEVMDALAKLQQQQASDAGARAERAKMWRTASIVAGIVATLVALGWIGGAEGSEEKRPVVSSAGAVKELSLHRLEVVDE